MGYEKVRPFVILSVSEGSWLQASYALSPMLRTSFVILSVSEGSWPGEGDPSLALRMTKEAIE